MLSSPAIIIYFTAKITGNIDLKAKERKNSLGGEKVTLIPQAPYWI